MPLTNTIIADGRTYSVDEFTTTSRYMRNEDTGFVTLVETYVTVDGKVFEGAVLESGGEFQYWPESSSEDELDGFVEDPPEGGYPDPATLPTCPPSAASMLAGLLPPIPSPDAVIAEAGAVVDGMLAALGQAPDLAVTMLKAIYAGGLAAYDSAIAGMKATVSAVEQNINDVNAWLNEEDDEEEADPIPGISCTIRQTGEPDPTVPTEPTV